MTESELRAKVESAAENRAALDGMRKSFDVITKRQKENASRMPDLKARKDRLRDVKESSVGDEELFKQAVATLQENGFRVIVAKTAEAALKRIRQELEGYDLVVKSKSNVTKEIHLAENLKGAGIEVIETDLGDRIIQLEGCEAAHPTGPACHLTRKQISKLFTRHFGRPVSEDPMELTKVMREEIASYLSRAKVGITGANAITALEGAVVVVHNEGNAAKCAMLPDKHIVVTTPEKVVPSLDDAVNVVKLQTYLSTGKITSAYVNVIAGPSYTADIEKQVYKGMHGPRDVIIVFVDDGRISAADKEPQFCIGCGMCLLQCPVYNVVGPVFGAPGHMGGQGVYLEGSMGRFSEARDSGLYLCTSCGACVETCPASIGTKKGLIAVRGKARAQGLPVSKEHAAIAASVKNYDNPWQMPRKRKARWADGLGLKSKGDIVYFAGCSTSLLFPESAQRVVRLMRAFGAEPAYLGEEEKCCGSTLRKLGEDQMARDKAAACFRDFKKAGAKIVVTSCPGCSSALRQYGDIAEKHGISVLHVSQFLVERLSGMSFVPSGGSHKATFHDPCDLGRELGIYDEPRALLAAAVGTPAVEMERSRELSACCGSGSGVKSAYPELAAAIGRDRVTMAKAAGADLIVTSCPWCIQNLRDCQQGGPEMPVVDLLELVEQSLRNAK